ncbi:MAG TPA: ABC transporter permease [Thermoanaerobaculia bacterium]|nr:ABC transporter permease [Thermoanaerobaculia bacterium]
MYRLLCVIVKELLQLRQDRKILAAMVVGPLIQLLALGYAANTDVNHVPTLLVDQDHTPASRALADRFTGSGYFALVAAAETADQVEPWLVGGRAQVALVIPARYGEEVAAGRTPRIQVIADGSDANSAVVGLGYAAKILSDVGAELVGARLRRAAVVPGAAGRAGAGGSSGGAGAGGAGFERIALDSRIWYNPDLRSRWFYVPAVLAMVLLLVTMILPSMAVVREKENGTLEQISVTPLRPWQLIVGKLLPFVLIGLVDLLLVVALARWVFGVPLRGSLALLVLLTLLYLLSTLALGLLVSTMVRNQQQAMMFSAFVLMVPMIYLSGLIFPIENMPHAIQLVTYAVPVRYYANIIRGIFLRGSGLSALWPDALALLGLGLALLTLAARRVRKSLD